MPMPATKGMTTRAAQAEQTRRQILDTAQRLFNERGYNATSLQMIADELGLTKAAVYYHFRAKSDILNAAMLPGLLRVEQLLDEAAAIRGRRARCEYLVKGYVDFLVQNRQNMVRVSTDPEARPKQQAEVDDKALHRRGVVLLFGEHPTAAERVACNAVFSVPDFLPELHDLTDEELREALEPTLLRILRIPAAPKP